MRSPIVFAFRGRRVCVPLSRVWIPLSRVWIPLFRVCVPPQRRKPSWALALRAVRRPLPSFYLLFTVKCLWTTRRNSSSPHFGSVVVIDFLRKFN